MDLYCSVFKSNEIKISVINIGVVLTILEIIAFPANLLSQNSLQGKQSILKFYRGQEILLLPQF